MIASTRRFILSKSNPLFYEGQVGNGIGSHHTQAQFIWPMSVVMEGLTNDSLNNLDTVWQRLEASHAGTFAMHESFNVNNPKDFTRSW